MPVKHAVDAFATMAAGGKGGVWQDMMLGFTTNAARRSTLLTTCRPFLFARGRAPYRAVNIMAW